MASTYLTRTPSSTGNRKKWTWSGWVKKTKIGGSNNKELMSANNGSNQFSSIFFNPSDQLNYYDYTTGYSSQIITNRLFRDTAAWSHIVIAYDSAQSTSSDRIKLYVNGVQETSFGTSTYPSQNYDSFMNLSSVPNYIGRETGTSNLYEGSMTHIHFCDSYAYDASSFGESDSTSGIWKPKTAPSVTYGTNGFFLKMENSGAMGTDSSGNSNTFTVSGTLTQNVDTPSNNFNTLNGIGVRASNFTLSNGNSSATCGADWETLEGTLGVNKGKWYYEAKWNGSNYFMAGWTSTNFMSKVPTSYVGHTITEPSYALGLNDAKVYYSTSSSATQDSAVWGNTLTSSDILGCAIDIDNGKLYWSKNGVWMNSGDPTSGATGTGAYSITDTATNYFWQPVMGCYNSAGNFNFGQGYFGTTAVASANADDGGLGIMEYDVPANYRVLCTKNIKDYG